MKKILILLMFLSVLFIVPNEVHALEQIHGPDIIYKQKNKIITIDDVVKIYYLNDYEISVINDTFTGYGNVIGTYAVTIQATKDASIITRDISIKVIESLPKLILMGDVDLYVHPDTTLSATDIRTALKNTGQITIPVGSAFEIITDTYSANPGINGVYNYDFKIISPSGTIQTIESKIYVSEELNDFNTLEPVESSGGGSNFMDSVLDFGSGLVLIFVIIILGYIVIKIFKRKV